MLRPDLTTTPLLRTERLLLREIRATDVDALFHLRTDRQVMDYIPRPRATCIEDVHALIEQVLTAQIVGDGISWAITLPHDEILIGTIGFYRLKQEHHRGEVGYALQSDHWRNGYMSEALRAVLHCGFEHYGFHSIEAVTDPRNLPSNALLERCGFVREGLFRQDHFWNGEFLDSAVYSLLATDPRT